MKNKIFYLIFFAIILACARVIPHPANFTPIIASAIMGPMLIKDKFFGTSIPIIAMFLADIIIGFHSYQIVIYLTIATISLIAPMKNRFSHLMIFSLASSIWFFIITNFAVWLAWDYYPKNIEGLIMSYTLAIPFFTNTIISTCLFTGLFSLLYKRMEMLNEKITNFTYRIYQLIF